MRKKIIMKYILIFSTALFLLFAAFNCKSPTAPKQNNPPDTTSSNFTWQVDTIGAEGSVLYDVAVINDTLAYAVGELFPRDSTGKADQADLYNAAVWNGTIWTMIKIPYIYQGKVIYNPIHAVFAMNANDIWFDFEHWDGKQYTQSPALFFVAYTTKIWESPDGSQVYILGDRNGLIAYSPDYGSTWQQVETGTTLPFQDIWGDGGQVLAIASSHNVATRQLYNLNGNMATAISDSGLYYVFGGLWFVANQKYYIAGDGVFVKSSLSQSTWYRYPLGQVASYYSNAIRGSAINDIVITGSYGDISHFNGKSWIEYKQLINTEDRLLSVSIKGNIIIAVGYRYIDGTHNYGLIYVGRR